MNKPISLLIVEDEALTRLYMVSLAKRTGCGPIWQTDTGEQAITLAKEHRPKLIFMDIKLKGNMDGIDAAERISASDGAYIVFISAFENQDEVARRNISRVLAYVSKPATAHQIDSILREAAKLV